jgi:hypothetical protein
MKYKDLTATMKKIFLIILWSVTAHTYCQTDKNGNPVFNSISIKEDSIDNFRLLSNYYTLKNNIDNKNSSVYISDNPDLDQIIDAAKNLPSDFFVLTKGQTVISMILLVNQPERKILVLSPSTGKTNEFKCSLKGDITENRANELVKERFDATSVINANKLFFNKKKFKIISTEEIKSFVLALINKENIGKSGLSQMKILSKDELRKLILMETKEGGKLDFFTPIKGHEYEGVQLKPGIIETRIGDALYKWGEQNFELGVNTVDDALSIFAEFKGRVLNEREKAYIKLGFEKK